MGSVLTTNQFISRSRAIHGDRYCYDLVDYKRNTTKVSIICKQHGVFMQTPKNHLKGMNCKSCADSEKGSYKAISQEDAIIKFKKAHGARYDYSLSLYLSYHRKIKILCPQHGVFHQTPAAHIAGRGCAKCGKEKLAKMFCGSTDDFIVKARNAHGHRYDYSDSEYKRNHEKVKIHCKVHGEFNQTPGAHLAGAGCPLCPKRFSDRTAVYVMSDGHFRAKIGVAINPLAREKTIKRRSPFKVTLHSFLTCKDYREARKVESLVHQNLEGFLCGYTGFDGATEWFNIEPCKAAAMVRQVAHQMDAQA